MAQRQGARGGAVGALRKVKSEASLPRGSRVGEMGRGRSSDQDARREGSQSKKAVYSKKQAPQMQQPKKQLDVDLSGLPRPKQSPDKNWSDEENHEQEANPQEGVNPQTTVSTKKKALKKKKVAPKKTQLARYRYDSQGHRCAVQPKKRASVTLSDPAAHSQENLEAPAAEVVGEPATCAQDMATEPSTPLNQATPPAPAARLPPRPPTEFKAPQSALLSLARPGSLPRRSRPSALRLDRLELLTPMTPSMGSKPRSDAPPGTPGGASEASGTSKLSRASQRSYARSTPHFSNKLSSFVRAPRALDSVTELRELTEKMTGTPITTSPEDGRVRLQKLAQRNVNLDMDILKDRLRAGKADFLTAEDARPNVVHQPVFRSEPLISKTPNDSILTRRNSRGARAPEASTSPRSSSPPMLLAASPVAGLRLPSAHQERSRDRSPDKAASPMRRKSSSRSPSSSRDLRGSIIAERQASMPKSSKNPSQRQAAASSQSSSPRTCSSLPSTSPKAGSDKKHKEKCHQVFRRLRDADGELHRDSLVQALGMLGFSAPEQVWVNNVYDRLFSYCTMNVDEFISFVDAYADKQEKQGAILFQQCDEDGSGSIDVDELSNLLASLGITPMEYVVKGIIKAVLTEDDIADDVELTYPEFKQVFEILRAQEGFTKLEVNEFYNVFNIFDRQRDGELQTSQLVSALSYLGYALDRSSVAAIGKEVDIDGSGTICDREFLVCMRKVREREILRLETLLEFDSLSRRSVKIASSKLQDVLQELGYLPEEQAMVDAAVDAGITCEGRDIFQEAGDLNFEEVWRFLEVYRKRDGLARATDSELRMVFERFDADGNGSLDAFEVGRMFRALGFPCTFHVQQSLVQEVDVNGNGKVDLSEFRKLLRLYHGREAGRLKRVFKKLCGSDSENATLPREHAEEALSQLGLGGNLSSEILARRYEYSFYDFWQLTRVAREDSREVCRERAGFEEEEVNDLRKRFNDYDADGGGEIEDAELRGLLEDLLPDLATNPERRPELIRVLEEADSDGSGSLDFDDFLRLVRNCHDLRDRMLFENETAAIHVTGFTPTEVAEFRELYLGEGERDQVDFSELTEILQSVIPLGDKNTKTLAGLYDEIVAVRIGEPQKRMNFAEYLLLLRRMLDVNFAGIANLEDRHSLPKAS